MTLALTASGHADLVVVGTWLTSWLRSAGFGGFAAVVAAGIAYRAASLTADRSAQNAAEDRAERERDDRKSQWWARAQWALDLTLSGDSDTRRVGFSMLSALADSEWAGEHEADVIAAATEPSLAALSTGRGSRRRLSARGTEGER